KGAYRQSCLFEPNIYNPHIHYGTDNHSPKYTTLVANVIIFSYLPCFHLFQSPLKSSCRQTIRDHTTHFACSLIYSIFIHVTLLTIISQSILLER
ncbi:hypothetical protein LDENG_00225810, partial [Lucifuga dentata]